jgi:hypothetical protein
MLSGLCWYWFGYEICICIREHKLNYAEPLAVVVVSSQLKEF